MDEQSAGGVGVSLLLGNVEVIDQIDHVLVERLAGRVAQKLCVLGIERPLRPILRAEIHRQQGKYGCYQRRKKRNLVSAGNYIHFKHLVLEVGQYGAVDDEAFIRLLRGRAAFERRNQLTTPEEKAVENAICLVVSEIGKFSGRMPQRTNRGGNQAGLLLARCPLQRDSAVHLNRGRWRTSSLGGVLAVLLWGVRRKRRQALLIVLAVGLVVVGVGSCGGGSKPPPPPTTATLTVTGTSGSATNSITLSLTVTH